MGVLVSKTILWGRALSSPSSSCYEDNRTLNHILIVHIRTNWTLDVFYFQTAPYLSRKSYLFQLCSFSNSLTCHAANLQLSIHLQDSWQTQFSGEPHRRKGSFGKEWLCQKARGDWDFDNLERTRYWLALLGDSCIIKTEGHCSFSQISPQELVHHRPINVKKPNSEHGLIVDRMEVMLTRIRALETGQKASGMRPGWIRDHFAAWSMDTKIHLQSVNASKTGNGTSISYLIWFRLQAKRPHKVYSLSTQQSSSWLLWRFTSSGLFFFKKNGRPDKLKPRTSTLHHARIKMDLEGFKKIESFICSHNRLPSNYFIIATSLRKIFVLIVQNRKKEQFIFFRTAHVHRSYGCHWVLIKERRSVMQLNGLKRIAHPNHMSTTWMFTLSSSFCCWFLTL